MASLTSTLQPTNSVAMQALRVSMPFAVAIASAALLTLAFLTQIGGSRPATESPLVVQTDTSSHFARFPGRPF